MLCSERSQKLKIRAVQREITVTKSAKQCRFCTCSSYHSASLSCQLKKKSSKELLNILNTFRFFSFGLPM